MNIIADSRPVRRIIVGAMNLQRRPKSAGCHESPWNKMRLRNMPFEKPPFRIAAGRVKIAENGVAEPKGCRMVGQHLLTNQLGPAIGVDRQLLVPFIDWHPVWNAIDGATAGKDDPLDGGIPHRR